MHRNLRRIAASENVGLALILIAVVFSAGFVVETFLSDASLIQEVSFLAAGGALAYGAIAHILSHYGYVRRMRLRQNLARPLDPAVGRRIRFGALIPSYREEPDFVYRAMLSVALQRTEHKWLRLLVDDPPDPSSHEDARLLFAARALPDRVSAFLAPLERIARQAEIRGMRDRSQATRSLARAHRRLSFRFARLARDWPEACADDRFFRIQILATLAVMHSGESLTASDDPDEALAGLAALRSRFTCDVRTFERKAFANLSHAANKAMNLNTGLDLIGKRVVDVEVGGERHIREDGAGNILFPPTDFVITLDADSLLSPEYAETLLAVATAEESQKVAVVQTPYAALPEPTSPIERTAGATTDVQRITHQGFSYFGAAFWVGANAVLRVAALRDIAVEDEERGHPIRRYIQDRTPIEDTESTIDLASKGWHVHNHDAVLAWSATPPDFGALVIQRRRWACGGLLMLPKAIGVAAKNDSRRAAILQLLVRGHYLGSLAWCPMALVALLAAPFDNSLVGVFLPLIAVPYFACYGLDLVLSRKSPRELPKIYALNLLLIPVNLAGALASLRQAITGRKVPFARTPKVANRTAAPAIILTATWGGAALLLIGAGFDALSGNESRAIFAVVNGAALLVAAIVFVGGRASCEDVLAGLATTRRNRGASASVRRSSVAPNETKSTVLIGEREAA